MRILAPGSDECPRKSGRFRTFFNELPKDLPDVVDQLGEPIVIYKPGKARLLALLSLGLVALVAGAVVATIYFYAWTAGKAKEEHVKGAVVFAGLCEICGLSFTWVTIQTLRSRPVVAVFKKGFVRTSKDQFTAVPWGEIDNVREAIIKDTVNAVPITRYKYTVELRTGEKLTFSSDHESDVSFVKPFGKRIREEVTRLKLPTCLATYREGGTVVFGSLSMDERGLYHNDDFLPWREIEELKVGDGVFTVRKTGKWFDWANVATATVPNVHVFLALVTMAQRNGGTIETVIVACPECGADVLDYACACPGCGCALAGGATTIRPDEEETGVFLPEGFSGWAIASLYLGLISVLGLPGPLALGAGIMAMRDIRHRPETKGMGRAIFGIVMGAAGTALLILVVIAWVMKL